MNKKWYPCELHCHTLHSDGDFTVEELISTAKERNLCGICLTDHNTMSGHRETEGEKELKILKGIEWTTYFGHMLVLDTKSYVDWRDATPDNIDSKISAVREQGGLVGIAHPFQIGTPICTGGHWDFKVQKWENVNYMEIFAEGEPYLNDANSKARKKWHSLLSAGYRITPTMGRDWHRSRSNLYPSACTYLLIDGDITAEKMKNAIKYGKTTVSNGALLTFETARGETSGDTLEGGEITLKISIDLSRHKLMEEREIKPEKIILCSSEGEKEFPIGESISFIAREKEWYSLELWGSFDDKENTLLCLSAPIYTK